MNQPNSNHVDFAIASLIDWQEREKAKNISFYSDALCRNELTVKLDREFTTQKSNCSICCMPQKTGTRQYWYKENHEYELHCWFAPICDQCFTELVDVAPLDELIMAQLPQAVIT